MNFYGESFEESPRSEEIIIAARIEQIIKDDVILSKAIPPEIRKFVAEVISKGLIQRPSRYRSGRRVYDRLRDNLLSVGLSLYKFWTTR